MIHSPVHAEIDQLLGSLDGQLTSHSRAIDTLLDVRSAADDDNLRNLVDEALRTMPGKNAVETDWLRDRLRYFDLMAQVPPVLVGDTSSV